MINKKTESVIEGVNQPLNFMENDEFFIFGEFDSTISTNVIPKLRKAIEDKKEKKNQIIKFIISSHGGYSHILKDLLGLFEIAKSHEIILETYVSSHAYSCGSMLACAGTKGHRNISEYAYHLCHLGAGSTGFVKNDVELQRGAKFLQDHFDFVRSVYKKYAKIKDLEKVIHDDNFYLNAEDCLNNGLADKII